MLEPLSGYLWLGSQLSKGDLQQATLGSSFNFGPLSYSNHSVAYMVNEIIKHWPGRVDNKIDPDAFHEANLLNLTVDKAQYYLGWRPVWNFERTIAETVGGTLKITIMVITVILIWSSKLVLTLRTQLKWVCLGVFDPKTTRA